MKKIFFLVPVAALAVLLGSCATSSIKSTWKAPGYHGGPVQKLAIIAVDERAEVRGPIERQFVAQLEQQGVAAFSTLPTLNLADLKSNKEAVAARLRQAGADAILLVRVGNRVSRDKAVVVTPDDAGYGSDAWYDFASFGPANMATAYYNPTDDLYLDTSLYSLGTSKRIWSCLSESVFKYNTDRYAAIKPLVAQILARMREGGMIR